MSRMPNFILIGRAKSGTTALQKILHLHPDIFMSSRKEPRFFVCEGGCPEFEGPVLVDGVTTLEEYLDCFAEATHEKIVGEASPIYLNSQVATIAAENIRRHIPHARLAAIIRQPADQIHSHYHYHKSRNEESTSSIRLALEEEKKGLRARYSPGIRYLENSGCYLSLKAYFDRFSREQLKIFTYEEWNHSPGVVLSELQSFLEIEPYLTSSHVFKSNVTGYVRYPLVHRIFRKRSRLSRLLEASLPQRWHVPILEHGRRLALAKPRRMDLQLRKEIIDAKREEILKIQDLIGKDLSHWLE